MIRELKNTDIEELTKLLINYDKNIENHFNFSYYLSNDIYSQYVYVINDKIVGYVLITVIDTLVEIHLLYVDNLFRNQKFGTKLMDYILKNDVLICSKAKVSKYLINELSRILKIYMNEYLGKINEKSLNLLKRLNKK